MSNFFNRQPFNRQPELFDTTKKLGSGFNQGSGSNLAAAGLAMMSDKPLAPDEIDSVPESWVELAPSRASLCSSIEAVNVESTSGGDASVNKDSRSSPVSLQSPHVEFEPSLSLEQVKYRLVKDIVPEAAKTDWLWDWTNRSDAGVSTEKTPRNRSGGGQVGSTLTTPPNSPEPESSDGFEFKAAKSVKKTEPAKNEAWWSALFRFDVLLVIALTNLFTGCAIYYLFKTSKNSDAIEESITNCYGY